MTKTRTSKAFRIFFCALSAVFFFTPSPAFAEDIAFFRIGTGGIGGTYFPIGGLIATAISNPPGSRPCEAGGNCGVPGLIAVAQSANGSVANVQAVQAGTLESGFAQSDVVYWAYTGTEIFQGKPRLADLRVIASLYAETVHLVARKGSGISSVEDLRARRISLDEPGSGTLVDARIILDAFGLGEADIAVEYIKPNLAAEKIRANELDAFFIVAGYPTSAVSQLAADNQVELIPIAGPKAATIAKSARFFSSAVIPAGTYSGIGEVPTLSVGAQWVVGANVSEDLVYAITRSLWNESSRRLLDGGHAKGRAITLETALDGVGIPLHPGAERFYREIGAIK